MATTRISMTPAYLLNKIKVFHQSQCNLDIPHLVIEPNQCVAILGDNGAGKSTLLNLLAYLSKPDEGELSLMGQQSKPRLSTLQRRSIGYVSQQPFLLTGSLYNNVALALKLQGISSSQRPKLTDRALQQVNLTHLASKPAYTLSGGELKRAATARAIAHEPQILLLDEPFSHLDQSHIQHLELIIEDLAYQSGKTVIFSTHDRLQGVALADTTINLIKGQITKSPLLNVFQGQLNDRIFNTGKLCIYTSGQLLKAHHVAIDPHEIIISTSVLDSSMRNHFSGRLTTISEEAGTIHLTIDCKERFYAIISIESLQSLNLSIGDNLCLSFKSTALTLF